MRVERNLTKCWFVGIVKVSNRRNVNANSPSEILEAYRAARGIVLHVLYQRPVKMLKKKFFLVDVSQVCTSPDKDIGHPNAVYSTFGQ